MKGGANQSYMVFLGRLLSAARCPGLRELFVNLPPNTLGTLSTNTRIVVTNNDRRLMTTRMNAPFCFSVDENNEVVRRFGSTGMEEQLVHFVVEWDLV